MAQKTGRKRKCQETDHLLTGQNMFTQKMRMELRKKKGNRWGKQTPAGGGAGLRKVEGDLLNGRKSMDKGERPLETKWTIWRTAKEVYGGSKDKKKDS